MENSKHWWQSKDMWCWIVTGSIVVYNDLVAPNNGYPPVPESILLLLAGMGLYARKTATATIK